MLLVGTLGLMSSRDETSAGQGDLRYLEASEHAQPVEHSAAPRKARAATPGQEEYQVQGPDHSVTVGQLDPAVDIAWGLQAREAEREAARPALGAVRRK